MPKWLLSLPLKAIAGVCSNLLKVELVRILLASLVFHVHGALLLHYELQIFIEGVYARQQISSNLLLMLAWSLILDESIELAGSFRLKLRVVLCSTHIHACNCGAA